MRVSKKDFSETLQTNVHFSGSKTIAIIKNIQFQNVLIDDRCPERGWRPDWDEAAEDGWMMT